MSITGKTCIQMTLSICAETANSIQVLIVLRMISSQPMRVHHELKIMQKASQRTSTIISTDIEKNELSPKGRTLTLQRYLRAVISLLNSLLMKYHHRHPSYHHPYRHPSYRRPSSFKCNIHDLHSSPVSPTHDGHGPK